MRLLTRNLTEVGHTNTSADYYIKGGQKTFTNQYAPLYAERLTRMRAELRHAAQAKWPDHAAIIKNLVDLVPNEKCVIIGTLYKDMKNKPNILRELADDENNTFVIQPIAHSRNVKYISKEGDDGKGDGFSDELILEDELQRILLVDDRDLNMSVGLFKKSDFCTGLVIALLGYENDESKFRVLDFCFKHTPFSPYKVYEFI